MSRFFTISRSVHRTVMSLLGYGGGGTKGLRLYVEVVKALHPELRMLSMNTCPVCGRRFTTRYGLMAHIVRGRKGRGGPVCGLVIESIIEDVVEAVIKVRRMYIKKGRGGIFECRICGFKASLTEVVTHILKEHGGLAW